MILYKHFELSNELQANCFGIISKFEQCELSKNEFKQKIKAFPGQKLRAGSGRKASEIAGTWKQYYHR
jgi:hypothetical protein